ncbi:hypothetical protein RRG08_037879 [Elysia crispata]|uniref:Uncharacterized protein n=1 Tax=Elysia crispata TaxID=231223 RepID=A0AAE1DHH3_9GAST|nr:hypothetical protein RRG08_037879 [Elysia crispata]
MKRKRFEDRGMKLEDFEEFVDSGGTIHWLLFLHKFDQRNPAASTEGWPASLVSRKKEERHQKNLSENEQLKRQIAEE